MTVSNITAPTLSSKVDPEVKRAIQTLVMHLQTVAAETAAISKSSTTETVATVDEAVLQQAVEEALASAQLFTPDYTMPVAPSDLTATGGFNQIMLEWSAVPGTYVGHYEVFRNTADNQGTAVKIGTTSAVKYVDSPPDSSLATAYFYWVRAVNKWDATIVGPFNATAGASARTSDDPEYLLQVSTEKWQSSHDYALGELSIPTVPNGYCYEVTVDAGSSGASEPTWPTVIDQTVVDGGLTWKCKAAFSFDSFFKVALVGGVPRLTLRELFLSDGIIKNAMMGSLAVDDANIANMSGGKITASSITASKYNELRNSLIFNGWDSLDASYPFEVPFLLLSELTAIQSVRLSFKIMPYRAYSTTTLSGGSSVQSTTEEPVPTHDHTLKIVGNSYSAGYTLMYGNQDGKLYLYKSGGATSGYYDFTLETSDGHNHEIRAYYTDSYVGKSYVNYYADSNTLRCSGAKVTTTEVNGHTHVFSLDGAYSGTNAQVYLYGSSLVSAEASGTNYVNPTSESPSAHTHDVTIPNHTHGIDFGIYEESNSPSITVNTDNGAGYGTPLGYSGDQLNIDLTSRFSGAGWKKLKFTASARCRIAFVLECKLDISA